MQEKNPKQKAVIKNVLDVGEIVHSGIDVAKEGLHSAKDAAEQAGSLAKSAMEAISTVGSGVGIGAAALGFILSPIVLWQGLQEGGKFQPWQKNKLKISGEVGKAIGAVAAIVLGAVALAIPGVAPTLALINAGIGFAGCIHQLAIASREFHKARTKLKEFNITQKPRLDELEQKEIDKSITTLEQKELFELRKMHQELLENSSPMKMIDIGAKSAAVLGGALFTVGLGVALIFPPAGLIIAAVGAAIGAASALVKFGSLLFNFIQKRTKSAAHDVQHDVTHDVQHDVTHDVQHDVTHDVQHNVTHDVQHDVTHGVQHDVTHNLARNISLDLLQNQLIEVAASSELQTSTKLQNVADLVLECPQKLQNQIKNILSQNKILIQTGDFHEVDKAMRKLALEYHPDKNRNNPNAAQEFNQLWAVLEALRDPNNEKRQTEVLAIMPSETHDRALHQILVQTAENGEQVIDPEQAVRISQDFHSRIAEARDGIPSETEEDEEREGESNHL